MSLRVRVPFSMIISDCGRTEVVSGQLTECLPNTRYHIPDTKYHENSMTRSVISSIDKNFKTQVLMLS